MLRIKILNHLESFSEDKFIVSSQKALLQDFDLEPNDELNINLKNLIQDNLINNDYLKVNDDYQAIVEFNNPQKMYLLPNGYEGLKIKFQLENNKLFLLKTLYLTNYSKMREDMG